MSSALLLGATGLVGSATLRLLLADNAFTRVVALARRPIEGIARPKFETRIGDLEKLDTVADAFAVQTVICALGTTIRQAGSRERFRAVDHDIPLAAARLAKARGVKHLLYVSSIGADPRSRNFYLRTKGELEEALKGVGLPRLTIVRPSLLLGHRAEFRLGERLGQLFAFIPMGRYTAIQADDVAAALVHLAKEEGLGVRIAESDELRRLARAARSA
jgi:uncharacterized protein YbjT (DUF2867 family)